MILVAAPARPTLKISATIIITGRIDIIKVNPSGFVFIKQGFGDIPPLLWVIEIREWLRRAPYTRCPPWRDYGTLEL